MSCDSKNRSIYCEKKSHVQCTLFMCILYKQKSDSKMTFKLCLFCFIFTHTNIPRSDTNFPWNNDDLSMQPFNWLACSQRSKWLIDSHSAMISLIGSFVFWLTLCSFNILAFKTSAWIVPFVIWWKKTEKIGLNNVESVNIFNLPLRFFHTHMRRNNKRLDPWPLYDPRIVEHQIQLAFPVVYTLLLFACLQLQVNWPCSKCTILFTSLLAIYLVQITNCNHYILTLWMYFKITNVSATENVAFIFYLYHQNLWKSTVSKCDNQRNWPST